MFKLTILILQEYICYLVTRTSVLTAYTFVTGFYVQLAHEKYPLLC